MHLGREFEKKLGRNPNRGKSGKIVDKKIVIELEC